MPLSGLPPQKEGGSHMAQALIRATSDLGQLPTTQPQQWPPIQAPGTKETKEAMKILIAQMSKVAWDAFTPISDAEE